MYDRIPDTLFRTKRGLCPCCGAPLPLSEDTSNLTCGFCGAKAVLERRLRRAEPEIEGAPLRQFDSHDHAGWIRTDRLREAYSDRPTCPGCSQGIDAPEHASRFACPACGTECHLERRLVPPPVHPLRGVPRPRHPEERYVYDLRDDEDAATEHLVWRLMQETDPEKATLLAGCFEGWGCINSTTSRLMPAILEKMCTSDFRPLVFQLSGAVDRCLCSDGAKARETIAAVEKWMMRVPAERQLISSLGLGTALGLKLLVDSSMLAYKQGNLAQSVACLFSINWMLQRNYPEHDIISRILMHRMFYLSGPPLAFCVMFMHGQVSDVAFRYDPRTTLAFLDDAVAERPILIPSLDHERAFWCGHAASVPDWNGRWEWCQSLRTDEARLAAWKWYLGPPEKAPAEFFDQYVARLLPMLDDQRPQWRQMAEKRLEWIIRRIRPTPDVFHRLVKERGEALPPEVRRAMLSEHPQCGLQFRNLPNWTSEPKPEEHPELIEARALYRKGLDEHLESKTDDRAEWKAFWDARGGTKVKNIEIFDPTTLGPPPPPRGRDRIPAPRPWEDDPKATPPIDESHRPAPGDETAPPSDDELAELLALTQAEAAGRAEDDFEVEDSDGSEHSDDEPRDSTDSGDDDDDQDNGDSNADHPSAQPVATPNDGSVTIWEWVASLPPDQQGQYAEMLKQLEPQRAMIEAAVAAQRGHAPPRPAPGDETAPPPATPDAKPGLLGKLFGRKK